MTVGSMMRGSPLHVVILVGPPGSGKSTFARQAIAHAPYAWRVVNQDTLGSRGACIRAMADALARRQHVIIDRCNFDFDQRRPWIELAQWVPLPCALSAIVFTPSLERCKARVLSRIGHPTLAGPGALRIVERMANLIVPPDARREGLEHVGYVRNNDNLGEGGEMPADAQRELQRLLLAAPLCAAQPRGARAAETQPPGASPPGSLRVATHNLLADCFVNQPAWYPSTPASSLEPSVRLAAALRAIRALDADVVCLQEATHAALNGLADSLAGEYAVSRLCANEPTAAPVPNGVAFLVKERGALANAPWTVERFVWSAEGSASAVLSSTYLGAPLNVMNSHLAFGPAGEDQARHALAWARDLSRAHPDGIFVWAGDFNFGPASPLVPCFLAAGLQDALGWSASPTYFPDMARDGARAARNDYVLYAAHTLALHSACVHGRQRPASDDHGGVCGGASEAAERQVGLPSDGARSRESSEGSDDSRARRPDALQPAEKRRRSDDRNGAGEVRRVTLKTALELGGSDHLPVVATLVPMGAGCSEENRDERLAAYPD